MRICLVVSAVLKRSTYSDVTYIVEGDNPPIGELGGGPATDVDKAVAKLIVDEIPNGACLQLGIGGMPNAVGSLIAESDLKDLGVHTEMYVDAFVDIAKAGKINGSKKNIDRFVRPMVLCRNQEDVRLLRRKSGTDECSCKLYKRYPFHLRIGQLYVYQQCR